MFGFLGKVFGGGDSPAAPERADDVVVEYNGYFITPGALRAGSHWQVAATIAKEFDGELKSYELLRADTHTDVAECQKHALQKAKRVIDEQGDRLFG